MAQPTVTKLDDGGFDVEFPDGGGRVILGADEASNQKDAVKAARERLTAAGRVLEDEGDVPADNTEVTVDDDTESNVEDNTAETAPVRTDETTGDAPNASESTR